MEELGRLLTHKHNTNRIVFTQIHVEQDRQHSLQFPPGRFESLQQQRQPGIYSFSYLSSPEHFSTWCCCCSLVEMLAGADFMKLSVEQFNKAVNNGQSQNMTGILEFGFFSAGLRSALSYEIHHWRNRVTFKKH